MKEINKIVHDENTYIESIGKDDKDTVREALADKGADTVLRLCFGMTGNAMPTRALGYYASALAVHELYFPEAELQYVYPFRAAYLANRVSIVDSTSHAGVADTEAKQLFARRFRTDHSEGGQVKSFFDSDYPSDELVGEVREFLGTQPELQKQFASKANGGDYAYYVAAHVLMHDSNPAFLPCEPLNFDAFEESDRGRVISIGAQSERPFYLARMACKQARIEPDSPRVETGQLFTRHIIPPYVACREGEPLLGVSVDEDVSVPHTVRSVSRDLDFLRQRLEFEKQFGDIAPQSDLVDVESRTKPKLGIMEARYV